MDRQFGPPPMRPPPSSTFSLPVVLSIGTIVLVVIVLIVTIVNQSSNSSAIGDIESLTKKIPTSTPPQIMSGYYPEFMSDATGYTFCHASKEGYGQKCNLNGRELSKKKDCFNELNKGVYTAAEWTVNNTLPDTTDTADTCHLYKYPNYEVGAASLIPRPESSTMIRAYA